MAATPAERITIDQHLVDGPMEKQVDNHDIHSSRAQDLEEASPRQLHGWKWVTAYAAMLSTTFLFALDNTITANIQSSVIHDLARTELLPWIGVGFALGSMAILPWVKAYGIFNMKWLYLFNIILFEVGSALCGSAPTMQALILGRVIAGIGGCGMYSGTLTYISILTSSKERPAYLAGSTVVWGIGSILGPVVGGAFAVSKATWRWGFYVNLVVGALFAPAYILLFPVIDPQPDLKLVQRCKMIDWIMTAVFLTGGSCFTMAISFGGTVYAWNSSVEIALWTVAGSLLIASIALTVFHPWVAKNQRLYPAHFLRNPILATLQVQVFLSSGVILAMTYYVPIFFQFIQGDGPLDAGVRLLPLVISMIVASMLNAAVMPWFSLVSPWYIIGSSLLLVGCSLMYTINEKTSNANIYGYTILIGTGAGCYIVAGFAIHQAIVSTSEISNAVSVMTIAQTLGMVLFLAIAGSVYQNTAIQRLSLILPDASAAGVLDLTTGVSSSTYETLSEEQKNAVMPEVMQAMSNVWLLFLVAAALSFVLSFRIWKTRFGDE